MRIIIGTLIILCVIQITGCTGMGGFAPSGLMDYSCEPNCKAKDYYIPGKGVWAEKRTMKKANYGALGGSAIAAAVASHHTNDPMIVAVAAVGGLIVGHEVGTTLDKIDQIHATMVLRESLNYNRDGQNSTWYHPTKDIVVNAMPTTTNGQCREFVTKIQVDNQLKQMRGSACLDNNEWKLKEIY